jgi:hypothetical protein
MVVSGDRGAYSTEANATAARTADALPDREHQKLREIAT